MCAAAAPGYVAGGTGASLNPLSSDTGPLRDFARTLLFFSTSRMIRFSIIEAWKLPHSCSFCRRYHSTLSRCILIALALASSSSCSCDFVCPTPPAAHDPRAPKPSRAYFFRVRVVSVFCRSCSASARFLILAFSSRSNCFVSASISSFWRSVRCVDCGPFAALYVRRGGGAVER